MDQAPALAEYFVPWPAKLGSAARSIFVVDLFAGAGTYTDIQTGETTDGSPVIFATQAMQYSQKHPGRSLQVVCVERDRKNWEALSERLNGFRFVTVLRGSFARHLDRISSIIGNAPALILFDPIGLKPIAADTIRPLLQRRGKTDVFMVLHFKVIHRTAGMLLDTGHANPTIPPAAKSAAMIDAVFNSPRWRFIAKSPRYGTVEARERAYLALYFEEVLGRRFRWKCAYPVRSKYLAKVQYWLVHASDHLDAHLLMNDEIVKLENRLFGESYGDGALTEVIEHENAERIRVAEERLRERVLAAVTKTRGASIIFGDLRDALLPEFFGLVKQGAYSRAAKALVKDEQLVGEQRLHAKFEDDGRLTLATSTGEKTAAA